MPKTPRFVLYKDKGAEYVIHMYEPRFVAKVTGKDTVKLHEQWDEDNKVIGLEDAIKKMQEWVYFTRDKK